MPENHRKTPPYGPPSLIKTFTSEVGRAFIEPRLLYGSPGPMAFTKPWEPPEEVAPGIPDTCRRGFCPNQRCHYDWAASRATCPVTRIIGHLAFSASLTGLNRPRRETVDRHHGLRGSMNVQTEGLG